VAGAACADPYTVIPETAQRLSGIQAMFNGGWMPAVLLLQDSGLRYRLPASLIESNHPGPFLSH
jgi:hypothetical protein